MHLRSILLIIVLVVCTAVNGRCAPADTLQVIVLSPYRVMIDDDCMEEYETRIKGFKAELKDYKYRRLLSLPDPATLAQMPGYVKQMVANDTSFLDSLTLTNKIAYLFRDYLDRQLLKTFKGKPRIILVTVKTSAPDIKSYQKMVTGKNSFIVNFPSVHIQERTKITGHVIATTQVELYSSVTNEVIYKKALEGNVTAQPYDIVSCVDMTVDCALLNSVYPQMKDCVALIASMQH